MALTVEGVSHLKRSKNEGLGQGQGEAKVPRE
jgi:hypothetical protein